MKGEMTKDKPFYRLNLREVCRGIRERRFTAESYTRALLARIASLDGEIGAWIWLEPERALRAARLRDRRIRSGAKSGPLMGVPVGVKDIFATAGIPTQMGSPAFAGHVPGESAVVIERLEAHGAFVLGKTVTTECAFLTPGKTRNPWNPLHTPGGSSSGTAAAVAAGFVPAALGTQTNGSVIRPAAYCGVVGYKPTQGMIPIEGALTFSHTLDQVGVFARSVEDVAWLAAPLAANGQKCSAKISVRKTPPRLAAVKTPVWDQAEEHARRNFHENIRTLRKAGARVEEVDLPEMFRRAHEAIRTIMAAESALNLEELYLRKPPVLSPTLRDFITEGRQAGALDYLQAMKLRVALKEELEKFLEKYNALITPPATGEAPVTLESTGNACFCSIWSLCGSPAVTIPVGWGPNGLPLGLQVVGPYGKDGQLLSAAHWCEQAFPFPCWEKAS